LITLISSCLIFFGAILFSLFYIISLQPATLALRSGEKAYKLCGRMRMISMAFEFITIAGYVLFIFGEYFNYVILTGNSLVIRIVGVVFTTGTFAFMFYGMAAAGKEAATPRKETKLYDGIYNYMRHPQTLGEMLSWFGIAMILNSLTLLIFSLVWLPLFIGYTIIEDNDLAVRFGKTYIEYTKNVGIFWKK
jgi:protein-S-isoprenylcysteine O-methyltransferase Ste14